MAGVSLIPSISGVHVPDIEHQLCVVKERVRSHLSTLSLKKFLRLVFIKLLWLAMFFLAASIPGSGCQPSLAQGAFLTGITLDYKKHYQKPIWAYAQVYDNPDSTNILSNCSVGSIAIGPTGNL